VARVARFILIVGLITLTCAACASHPLITPAATATASTPQSGAVLPPLAVLRAGFERVGVRFGQEDTINGPDPILNQSNTYLGSSGHVFFMVQIVGDPPTRVDVSLAPFVVDANGRFPGSALIDFLDSWDPGLKRWYVAQATDPTLGTVPRRLNLNGFIAEVSSPVGLTIVVTVENGLPS
jgi:hypothetical protein